MSNVQILAGDCETQWTNIMQSPSTGPMKFKRTCNMEKERFPAAAHAFEQHTQMWVINGCQSET